jgi:hypothetical protein
MWYVISAVIVVAVVIAVLWRMDWDTVPTDEQGPWPD